LKMSVIFDTVITAYLYSINGASVKERWIFKIYKKMLADKSVEKRYVAAGAEFGEAISYSYLGEPVGLWMLLDLWQSWEKEYARRGYRTISMDEFVKHGGWGKPLKGLGKKRGRDERPISYAEMYRKNFLIR